MKNGALLCGKIGSNVCAVGVALIASYLLKRHYASASPAELGWILHPTAWLVEALSGHAFPLEPGVGRTSVSAGVAITKACAGVNFLIVCWLSLVWLVAMRGQGLRHIIRGALAAAAAAYAVTLLVNGLRILMAMHLHREHRIEGTALYLLALLLTVCLADRVIKPRSVATPGLGSLLVPLGIYLSVTLVVPLLNGAASREAYWQHFLAVTGLTALVALAILALSGIQPSRGGAQAHKLGSAPGGLVNDATPHTGGAGPSQSEPNLGKLASSTVAPALNLLTKS